MNSIKCPNCGLVSFATAPDCKRCHAKFLAPPDAPAMALPATQFSFSQNVALPMQPASFQPLPEYEATAPPIGGWLIVFAISTGIGLILSALFLPAYINFMWSQPYNELTTPGSKLYISSFSPAFNLEFVWLLVSINGSVLLLFRFFKKSSSFPRLAVFILAAHIVVASIDFLMAISIERQLTEKLVALYGASKTTPLLSGYMILIITYSILSSVVWIMYFRSSRRVELTFIN